MGEWLPMHVKTLVLFALLLSISQGVFAEETEATAQAPEQNGLPDLFIETVKAPVKVAAGNEAVITARIKNSGSASATPFYTYLYALPGFFAPSEESVWKNNCAITRRQGHFVNKTIQPGESAEITFGVSCKKPGSKTFLLKADFFNKVKEDGEKNNIEKVAIEFESRPEGSCTDSDGGVTPLEKGYLTDGTKTAGDVCYGKFLREYYCNKNSKLAYQVVKCEKGCLDGACQS